MSERDPVTGRFPKGNGAGWGGPAKGASKSRLTSDAYGDAIRALAHDPKHMAAKAELRVPVLTTLVEVMLEGEVEASRVAAANSLAKKVGLPDEPAETRVTGAEGGAIVIERRIVDPDD